MVLDSISRCVSSSKQLRDKNGGQSSSYNRSVQQNEETDQMQYLRPGGFCFLHPYFRQSRGIERSHSKTNEQTNRSKGISLHAYARLRTNSSSGTPTPRPGGSRLLYLYLCHKQQSDRMNVNTNGKVKCSRRVRAVPFPPPVRSSKQQWNRTDSKRKEQSTSTSTCVRFSLIPVSVSNRGTATNS